MRLDSGACWDAVDTGAVHVCIDAHRIVLFKEAGELHHCLGCELDDGRGLARRPGTAPALTRWNC
ncbi:hypothetical protein ULF88_25220 [Halopseudomonas pachastrellae]|nr:hypothetical protein [Halopseudomonas pachastrellae]